MKTGVKDFVQQIPGLGSVARQVYGRCLPEWIRQRGFRGSAAYWEGRYLAGNHSGVGSYGQFAEFKAEVLNAFVEAHDVQSVIEFGCGDGNQLALAEYPEYLGIDVSATALAHCRERFADDSSKTFRLTSEYRGEQRDLSLSLDVIYHLVEDDVFQRYMQTLFDAAQRYVVIYSSNSDDNDRFDGLHVRHRMFTRWIELYAPDSTLVEHIPNRYPFRGNHRTGSFADFYIYQKPLRSSPDYSC